tara:strand:+ start:2395 stop:3219 length:825 start_codon:yes stop_codon:yes gene_type:complete
MNTREPYILDEIDFNNICFTKVKQTNKKKIVYLKYKNHGKLDNLVIQTPTLWSIKKPLKIGDNIYDLEIPLIGKRKSNVDTFINFLSKLDAFIIKSAKTNASSWFNSSDQAIYINSIRESNEYSIKTGFIKLKIIKSYDFKTVLKKNNKVKLKLKDIKENNWIKSIIQIFAIWIKPNNQFGIYFKPIIISFKDPIIENINYNFIKETEDEDNIVIDSPINNNKTNNIFIKKEDLINNQNDNVTSILKIDVSSFNNNSSTSSDNLVNIDKTINNN